jgi:cytochrome P450
MINPFDPAFLANRHEGYRRLREDAPILPIDLPTGRLWLLSRYEDVARVVKESAGRVKAPGHNRPPKHFNDGAAAMLWKHQVVLADPPDHTRLRKLAMPAFRQDRLKALEGKVRTSVEKRLAELAGRDEVDIVAEFASFVPASTIMHVMGLPDEDWGPLLSRVPDFLHVFSPVPLPPEIAERANDACAFYIDYFGKLVDRRMGQPGDDIVGALITAYEDGDRLSRDELIAMLQSFLNAGYETTMSALGGGLFGLLSHEDQREAVRADPSGSAEAAFDEMLRWDAPVHFVMRYLPEPLTLHGVTIPAGEPILLALASANRDQRRFVDPDRFDLNRTDRQYMTFGGGRHFCLGAPLAKMEAKIALELLFKHFPGITLANASAPERQPHLLFPAVKALSVKLGMPARQAEDVTP